MPALKNPAREVKFDGKRINLAGNEIGGVRARVALRATLSGAGDHRHGAVGRDVGKAHEPIGERRAGGNLQRALRPAEDRGVFIERRGIVDQTVGVNRTLVGGEIAPPESGFVADGRDVLQLMWRRCSVASGGTSPENDSARGKNVSRVRICWRPGFLCAPVAGNFRDVRIRRIPVAHVNFEARLVHDSVLTSLQPVIPPARSFHAPFDGRAGLGVVRKSVIPRADQTL